MKQWENYDADGLSGGVELEDGKIWLQGEFSFQRRLLISASSNYSSVDALSLCFLQIILFQHYWLFYLFVLQIYHTNAHNCCQPLLSDVSTQKITIPSWLLLRLCCVVNKIAVGFSIIIFSRTFLFVFYLRCANCSWTSTTPKKWVRFVYEGCLKRH